MKGKISVLKLSITLDNRHTPISLITQISDLTGCCLLGVGVYENFLGNDRQLLSPQ